VVLAELLNDRPDRMDWVSEVAWSSDNNDRCGGLNAGDEGCMGGTGGGKVAEVGPEAGAESPPECGGTSPML
jgi:hypothetical protein